MKSFSDLLQILLSLPGWVGYVACTVIVALTLQGFKVLRFSMRSIQFLISMLRTVAVKPSFAFLAWVALLALPLWVFRQNAVDGLQWFEQRYVSPVYLVSDTSSFTVQCFETEMSRYLSPAQMAVAVSMTAKIAADCKSSPACFYEVYNSECAMNPFAFNKDSVFDKSGRFIRVDTVAAGIIQFTQVGISGLGVSWQEVKDACVRHDIDFVMSLAHKYMLRASGGVALPRPCDVYTAVFMPSFVGSPDDTSLASLYSNRPQYYLQNIGLDGYYLQQAGERQIIMRSRKARDFRITINDLALVLAAKKYALIARYEKARRVMLPG